MATDFPELTGVQADLFEPTADDLTPLVTPAEDDPRQGTVVERARRFHARNPQVYRFAVRVARYMKGKGLARYSIKAVWEIMRFKYLESKGDIYKLNNSYTAFYAREIMARESDLAGFFTTRRGEHDDEYGTREVR